MTNTDRQQIEQFCRFYQEQKSLFSEVGLASIAGNEQSTPSLLESGRPLITAVKPHINKGTLLQFALELEGLFRTHVCDKFHNLVGIIESCEPSGKGLDELVWRTCSGEGAYLAQVARRCNLQIDQLSCFAIFLARPVRQAVRLASPADFGHWRLGFCPVCGLWPRMARIEAEEKRRWLWCVGCETEWPFPRLSCPFCLEGDQTKLGYLKVEDEDGYRIYTCESCRRYLKTLVGKTSVESLDVEYLLSAPLDVTASFEKYIQDFVGFAAFDLLDNNAARLYREKATI